MGWETYEPPQEPNDGGSWLFPILGAILFVNLIILEMHFL